MLMTPDETKSEHLSSGKTDTDIANDEVGEGQPLVLSLLGKSKLVRFGELVYGTVMVESTGTRVLLVVFRYA